MEWLEKTRSQNRTEFDDDIILSYERRANQNMIAFRFRKNSVYKVISNEEYIVIAKDGSNIYFKGSDAKHGFKICNWSPSTKVFKIKADRLQLTDENLGEYNLEFDSKLGLCYINLHRKLEKSLFWEGK